MPLHHYASRNAAYAPGEKGLMCERRRGKGPGMKEGSRVSSWKDLEGIRIIEKTAD
jgi:hypothetical protein